MEGTDGTWLTGQLVVGGELRSTFAQKLRLEACWTLPSPSRILPAPAVFPAECIFNDHETGLEIGTATSAPAPFVGEYP
jgi:hypothetical protein